MIKGLFIDLDTATLTTMKAEWQAALSALALNQSYSIAGRAITRANLADVSKTLSEICYALEIKGGDRVSRTYASFNFST